MLGGQDGAMRNTLRPLLILPILLSAAACSSVAATNPPAAPAGIVAATSEAALASSHATQATEPASSDSTQTSDRAGVTIVVTWTGPTAGAVFEVKMDNHVIDLGSVDLSKAVLTNDRAEQLSGPTVEGGSSGHHRDVKLTFANAPAGVSTAAFFFGAAWVQLELPAVADSAPRDFKWQLSN
jgi:hypothetical protein